jgi:hypothetical protein
VKKSSPADALAAKKSASASVNATKVQPNASLAAKKFESLTKSVSQSVYLVASKSPENGKLLRFCSITSPVRASSMSQTFSHASASNWPLLAKWSTVAWIVDDIC